jgi:hypothetical protein
MVIASMENIMGKFAHDVGQKASMASMMSHQLT